MSVRRHGFLKKLFFSLFSLTIAASSLQAARIPIIRIIVAATQPGAEQILSEIDKGASFASLAKERSVDEKSRDSYGEIEPAAFESLEAPLKDAALRLREGEVSGVIALGNNRYALVQAVDMGHYRKGTKAFRAGDFGNAELHFLKHVELNPDAIKARVFLGRIYAHRNDIDKAEANYREALRFGPGYEEAYQRLGDLYLHIGQVRQADDIFIDGLLHIPGSKALKTGQEKAEALLSAAGSGHPERQTAGSQPAGNDVAPVDEIARKNPKADLPGEETPKAGPSQNIPSNALPSADAEDKKIHLRIITTKSEADAQEILSQFKEGKPFALLARERSADEKSREAYGYLGEVDVNALHASIRKALSSLKEGQTSGVIRMDADNFALVQVTDMGLYREGEKAFIAGDYAAAEEKLLSYVKANPDAVKARGMLGKIYEDKKEFSQAIAMYRESISYSPKTVLLYERLARVYLFIGEYRKARSVYVEGLSQVHSSAALEEGIEMADLLMIGNGGKTP
jgi:parvulin-like peptidyl-prolyl isomerase